MKKQLILICAAIMLALCFSATGAMAEKDKCILLGYDWARSGQYDYAYLWLYADGTIGDEEGIAGYWDMFKGAFRFQGEVGCSPLYAGTKSTGFMQCTDGSGLEAPGFYRINYVSKKKCEKAMTEIEEPNLAQDAGSCFSPE